MTNWVNDAGEVVATNTFTQLCLFCDDTYAVVEGIEVPHCCRINLDARLGRSARWSD